MSINTNNKKHYDKYVIDNTNPLGDGRTETAPGGKKFYGQQAYGVIGQYDPINCDPTRNTENDNIASELIRNGKEECVDDSEGGMY